MIIKYEFADGTESEIEVDEKFYEISEKFRRKEENLLRKERYHDCVSFESLDYEGEIYTDERYSPEKQLFMKESAERVEKFLSSLTEIQRQRAEQLIDGKSIAKIAKDECVSFNTVKDCVICIQKKLKIFENIPQF